MTLPAPWGEAAGRASAAQLAARRRSTQACRIFELLWYEACKEKAAGRLIQALQMQHHATRRAPEDSPELILILQPQQHVCKLSRTVRDQEFGDTGARGQHMRLCAP